MISKIAYSQIEAFGLELEVDPQAFGDKDKLRDLYDQDALIVIRNLHLTMDDQLELCSAFGPVLRNRREAFLVSNTHKDGCSEARSIVSTQMLHLRKCYVGRI